MAVVVVPLVALLLGPAWSAAGATALPLIALAAWLFLWFPAGAALVARGVPNPALIANSAAVVVMLIGVVVLRPKTPTEAMTVWLIGQLVTSPYTMLMTARVLDTGMLRPIRAGLPALAVAVLSAAAALLLPWLLGEPRHPAWLIAVRLAAGAPICLLGLACCLARPGMLPPGSWPRGTTSPLPLGEVVAKRRVRLPRPVPHPER